MTALRKKYIRDLALRGRAERTQKAYTDYVASLARYYGQSPEVLTYDQVCDWLYYLLDDCKLAASSVNVAVNAVRFLYGTTLERDLRELQAKVPHLKRVTKRAHAYAVKEVEALLQAPRRLRDRALLMLAYSCGLRLNEVRQLRVGDIDRARMQVRVRGKGNKERLAPMSAKLLGMLEAYWRAERRGRAGHDCAWLFLGRNLREPISRVALHDLFCRAVAKSGVPRKGGLHVLRHSFATHLIESGVEITLIQRLLGHTNLATTALYLHVTSPRLERVRSAMDLIDTGHPAKAQSAP